MEENQERTDTEPINRMEGQFEEVTETFVTNDVPETSQPMIEESNGQPEETQDTNDQPQDSAELQEVNETQEVDEPSTDLLPDSIDQLPPLPKKFSLGENVLYTLPIQGDRFVSEPMLLESVEQTEPVNPDPPITQTAVTINTNRVEEEEEEEYMDPNHPLLARIQLAIRDQLTRHTEKLELELRTRQEEAKKQITRREDLGVELYNAQQHLAKTQALFEGAVENFEIIKSMREESERGLKMVQQEYEKTMAELNNQQKNMEAHQTELEKASRTLNQLEVYQSQLQSRILVAKRTTLKTEKDILVQELEKKNQDLLIDSLTLKLRSLQERKATYENQLHMQARETHAARETLQDAQMEMEAIQFEKRQLVNQWKSTLLALQKRNSQVEALELAMNQNLETLQSLGMELKGYQKTIRQATEQGEELTAVLQKLEHEMEYIKRHIATIFEQREKLGETYSGYIKSLGQTEKELLVLNGERVSVQSELNQVIKATLQTTQAIQKLELEMDSRLKTLASVEKEAEGSRKDTKKLRLSIHEKQNQVAQHGNEIAQLNLECQNTTQRIESMKERLVGINQEIENQNKLVAQYEQQIRLNTDTLSKKASELDTLNKKLDALVSKTGSENMGPLEATIHNLSKSITNKEKECLELQQYWLRAQNELVQLSKKANEVTDEIQTLRVRLTVLNRKKMVVNAAFENEEKEQRELKRTIRHLQNEMVKVNTILSQQHNIYEKLQESNLEMEAKFRNKLKDAELDSVQMEATLDQLKKDKQVALQEIIDAERQIMCWEKKIQLAKETQAALDPNVGATEIREMSLEIHRMSLRYASMLKLQEKMIQEMEKSVYRRESIGTKGAAKTGNQQTLSKQISDLTKKIEKAVADIKEIDGDIAALVQHQESMKEQINDANVSKSELQSKGKALAVEIQKLQTRKQLMIYFVQVYQKLQRRYADLQQNKYTFIQPDENLRQFDIEKNSVRLDKIEQLVQQLEPKAVMEEYEWFIHQAKQELLAS